MGFSEILLIMLIVFILFGPEDLPIIARRIGKILLEVRKVKNELTKELRKSMDVPVDSLYKTFEQTTSPFVGNQETHSSQRNEKPLKQVNETHEQSAQIKMDDQPG
ncbi:twin-arginine translocase TatA/TatE family subunit [Dehalobacter sp.]|uniref:Sec-independent protein translocase subunit TatA/TatB n=1 Tax=Dehalobacter sp. TaxID=1962289 RepID=UPI00258D9159|nr:twin-arginine translocase TatA/TatE family subunit [Dehalobacter sp.]MDJ0306636.1 twin-arginine translocase TatA/TatE family subunit [Dehalobacter sp.]